MSALVFLFEGMPQNWAVFHEVLERWLMYLCLAKLSPFPYNIIYETIEDFIHNFFFIKWNSKKSKLIYPSFYNLQKKLVMPSNPCGVFFSWPFSFLMHPWEGSTYILARVVQASCCVQINEWSLCPIPMKSV
jgi:hypothetical protein